MLPKAISSGNKMHLKSGSLGLSSEVTAYFFMKLKIVFTKNVSAIEALYQSLKVLTTHENFKQEVDTFLAY
ncbi:hypothetical protein [Colwellia sp. MB3u-55]|jgi:hypothetical protein|uniref:hypothetical protein n=1 Tax=Colwellia sp. MB3u-55 TaxID=2759810 RepID=UPI0015F57660|nr:hypothetical protein [Colwellia sp. MB3u-55]MBA6252642.1 hypothetical protein [Colwellia sp. MB3u-55]